MSCFTLRMQITFPPPTSLCVHVPQFGKHWVRICKSVCVCVCVYEYVCICVCMWLWEISILHRFAAAHLKVAQYVCVCMYIVCVWVCESFSVYMCVAAHM